MAIVEIIHLLRLILASCICGGKIRLRSALPLTALSLTFPLAFGWISFLRRFPHYISIAWRQLEMKRAFVFVASAAAIVTTSADAGILGFSSFTRTASNGNIVVDVFAVMSNASDRLLNVYNANLTTTQGGSTLSTFVQQAGTATRGWKPDGNSSTRSNIVDSFMTIGVNEGAPYEGQYYAAANTSPDGNFTNWSSLAPTVPVNAGWFLSPPTLPDNVAESMSGMTGTRVNTGTAGTSNLGIWCAHLVMAPGTSSVFWAGTSAVKDGVTGATVTTTAQSTNLLQVIPAPGALALLGIAGFSSRRRRA
jgi:hypothetical protein